uniref:Uncharacterized protein n=1 Tax=Arundo donax TaxID=35708 RepID=A0A0A9AR37_ARUDO
MLTYFLSSILLSCIAKLNENIRN